MSAPLSSAANAPSLLEVCTVSYGRQQTVTFDAQPIEPAAPMVCETAGFHEDKVDGPILEPGIELASSQSMLLNDFPLVISNGNWEYTLGARSTATVVA